MIKSKIKSFLLLIKVIFERLLILSKLKNNYAYIGGHGFKNYGDDVMFYLLKEYCDTSFGFNIITIHSYGIERILMFFKLSGPKFFKKIVLGGGTLINDMWYQKVQDLQRLNIPMIALGTGVGSCGLEQNSNVKIDKWGTLLRKFEFVGVRGEISLNRIKGFNINAKITGDLALLGHKNNSNNNHEDKIVLNLMDIDEYNVHWELILSHLKEMNSKGWIIEPLILNNNDLDYTKKFFERIGIKANFKLVTNYEQLESILQGAMFSICVRLHAAVLSYTRNVPAILFGYRDKCEDFMGSIDMFDLYCDLNAGSKTQDVLDKIDIVSNHKINDKLRFKINQNVESLKSNLIKVIENEYSSF